MKASPNGRARVHAAFLSVMAATGFLRGQTAPPADEMLALESVLHAAIDKVSPSVVTVETWGGARKLLVAGARPPSEAPERRSPDDKPKEDKKGEKDEKDKKERIGPIKQPGFLQTQGATTGIILSADGWILVSRFALNFNPTTILVTLADGRTLEARRAGEDTSRGIALLKIEAENLPVPEFFTAEKVRVGQWAFVLGRTFGRKEPSVHMGIVSAVGRLFDRAIQTDAYVSPANYGGPLIDGKGRVLGVAVPLSRSGRDAGIELYDSGIGFAATVTDIGSILERMKTGEILHRGFLGVTVDQSHLGPGAKLAGVARSSAAWTAGLRAGGLITAIGTAVVKNGFHLQNLVSSRMAGDSISLTALTAEGKELQKEILLAELPQGQRKAVKPSEEAGTLPWEEGRGGR